jgi:hypothetical protein
VAVSTGFAGALAYFERLCRPPESRYKNVIKPKKPVVISKVSNSASSATLPFLVNCFVNYCPKTGSLHPLVMDFNLVGKQSLTETIRYSQRFDQTELLLRCAG